MCGKGVGAEENLYIQHKKSECKSAYLFLISLTLRSFESDYRTHIYFCATQAFPYDILHTDP